MHKRSARSLHLNGSVRSGGTSLFGGGTSMVLPTANNAGTIFKVGEGEGGGREREGSEKAMDLTVLLFTCSPERAVNSKSSPFRHMVSNVMDVLRVDLVC